MFGLSFLSPWFLAGILAVAGPVLLHLFARQNAPVTWLPTMRFVPRAAVEQTRRRRLQDVLLLILRVLAIVLLAAMFARPFVNRAGAEAAPSLGVVAVDTSFSMAGGGRDEAARRLARTAVDEMPSGARVALMTFGQNARVVIAPTTNRRELRAAIDAIVFGYESTNYASVVRGALELVERRPARLVVVTDAQRAGADAEALPAVPGDFQVTMRPVPAATENLSVDAVEAFDDHAMALVRNHGPAARRTAVRWTVDGTQASEALIDVPAQSAVEARLDRRPPPRALVTAAIDDAAGYAADNTRFLVTDPPVPVPVTLIWSIDGSRESHLYVEAALEAATRKDAMFAVTAVAADDRHLKDGSALRSAAVIVVLGTRGLERSAREAIGDTVRGGRGLLVAAGPDTELGVVRDLLGGAVREVEETAVAGRAAEGLVATDVRHPVLAALGDTAANLGQVRVDRAWTLREPAGATTLVRLADGRPAVCELPVGRGTALVFTTDLGRRWNTWPLHPTFVPLVVEAVRHLSGQSMQSREVLVGALRTSDANRPGVVTGDATAGRVAVNVDPRESRIEGLSPEAFAAGLERLAIPNRQAQLAREAEQGQALWRDVAMLLLAVLAIEGLIASRTRAGGTEVPDARVTAAAVGGSES